MIISQPHLGVLALNLCNRDVGYLAPRTTGCGHYQQGLLLHYGYRALKGLDHVVYPLQAEELARVDDGTATHGDYPFEGFLLRLGKDSIHHFIARLAQPVLLLEDEVALEPKSLHVGLVDELVGYEKILLIEVELFGKFTKGVELVDYWFEL